MSSSSCQRHFSSFLSLSSCCLGQENWPRMNVDESGNVPVPKEALTGITCFLYPSCTSTINTRRISPRSNLPSYLRPQRGSPWRRPEPSIQWEAKPSDPHNLQNYHQAGLTSWPTDTWIRINACCFKPRSLGWFGTSPQVANTPTRLVSCVITHSFLRIPAFTWLVP